MPGIYSGGLSEALPTTTTPPIFRQPQADATSRRATIFSLVELLLQQNEESIRIGRQFSKSEDDIGISNSGEHLQGASVEVFNRFERRINNLDKELRNFANAARQLGSSVAILSSAFHLRERLAQVLFLFRQNAADLFPERIQHATHDAVADAEPGRRRDRVAKPKAPPHISRPIISENLDLEMFPQQLEAFASDVAIFLNCLNEFPEFTDEAVNVSIHSFEGDLKYWASCLKEYRGRFRYPSVQRYIHDLSCEMGDHIDSIASTISMFIEIGVPTIRFAQNHGAANLLNLSTVATFFSAVTATTMQFSYPLSRTPIGNAVNTFWFSSMVFSIAAAVNSLLGVTWKQAMYRSPGHRVPWWVLIWIKRSPLVFLVMSVACFSLGLCCFAYASDQDRVTSTLTTVFTAFTSFGLTAVSAWFASERYIFLRHRGKKWLSDVLMEYGDMIMKLAGFRTLNRLLRQTQETIFQAIGALRRVSSKFLRSSQPPDDLESGTLPIVHLNSFPASRELSPAPPARLSLTIETPQMSRSPQATFVTLEDEPASPISPGKELWKNALRSVKMHTAIASPYGMSSVVGEALQPSRKRTNSSSDHTSGYYEERRRTWTEETINIMSRSRVALLRPRLNEIEPVHDLAAHSGLVRHLKFSPDGKFLATSSWDRTSVIFTVGDPFVSHRILAHPQGFVGQVAWSPNGKILLTKLPRIIKIWTSEDGVCKRTIDRGTFIESIAWLPDGNAFISVEGSIVTRMDPSGTVLDQYDFGRIKLHAVAVTPDSSRLIGVGTLLESPTGLQPRKARPEKRLIVYNMGVHYIENQTPVLNDVRDITVVRNSRSGNVALISYEHQAPPQLWKLQSLKDRENNVVTTRLILRQTYMPTKKVDFAGPSYFGGKNNELVICAAKAGDIFMWDQESAILLHHIRPEAISRDMTCLAWNGAHDNPFMFATGSYDGAVRIWTKRPEETEEEIDTLENFEIGRGVLRTSSPSELDPQEPLDNTHPPQYIDSSHSQQSLLLGQRHSSGISRISDLQSPSKKQLFQKRILAYAAAQRAAEATYSRSLQLNGVTI